MAQLEKQLARRARKQDFFCVVIFSPAKKERIIISSKETLHAIVSLNTLIYWRRFFIYTLSTKEIDVGFSKALTTKLEGVKM